MKMKKRRLLSLTMAAMMLFATACGSADKEGDSTGTQTTGDGSPSGQHFIEKQLETPATPTGFYNNSLIRRPDGKFEMLVIDYEDAFLSAAAGAAPAAQAEPVEAAPEEESPAPSADPATAESPQEEQPNPTVDSMTPPQPTFKLFVLDPATDQWDTEEPTFMESLPDVQNINGMDYDAEGNRYILYTVSNQQDETQQTTYTPPMPHLVKLAKDGQATSIDLDWYVHNWQSGTVEKATFLPIPMSPAADATASIQAVDAGNDSTDAAEATATAEETSDTSSAPTAEVSPEATDDATADAQSAPDEEISTADTAIMLDQKNMQAQNSWPTAQGLMVSDDGNLFINEGGSLLQYDPSGQYVQSFEVLGSNLRLVGNNLIATIHDKNFAYFDITQGNTPIDMAPIPSNINSYQTIFTEDAGTFYLACSSGIYSWQTGQSEWTLLAGQELLALTIPDASFTSFFCDGNGGFYLGIRDYSSADDQNQVVHIQPSDAPPTEIVATLHVFALDESTAYSARRAIYEYRVAHPDVMVDLTIGRSYDMSGSSASKQEIINAFNTELLAGKGADIIILDDMPIQSYIEKGVLADISQWVTPRIDQNGWMEGLARAYEQDGKIYALPSAMVVPVMVGPKEAMSQIHTLHDLAAYVKANPNGKPAFFDTVPRNLLGLILSVYPDLFADDGSVNVPAMTQFLEDIKTISETDGGTPLSSEMNQWYDEAVKANPELADDYSSALYSYSGSSVLPYAYGETNFASGNLYSLSEYRLMNAAIDKTKDGSLALLPAGDKKVYLPNTILGINAATKEMERSMDLLEIMTRGTRERFGYGISLTQSSLIPPDPQPGELEQLETSSVGFGDEKGRSLFVEGNDSKEHALAMIDFLEPLNTPIVVDTALLNAVGKGSAPYFEDKIDVNQAVENIQSELKIYLSERAN